MTLGPASEEDLAACLEACAAFFAQVGQEPSVRELLDEKPPGPCEKEVLGVFDPELVGVVDLLHGYPTPDTCFIGLLVLRPELRGRGLGRRVEQALVQRSSGAKVRLAVNHDNPKGRAFWESCGYRVIAEVPLREAVDPTPTCWLLQKRLRWL